MEQQRVLGPLEFVRFCVKFMEKCMDRILTPTGEIIKMGFGHRIVHGLNKNVSILLLLSEMYPSKP